MPFAQAVQSLITFIVALSLIIPPIFPIQGKRTADAQASIQSPSQVLTSGSFYTRTTTSGPESPSSPQALRPASAEGQHILPSQSGVKQSTYPGPDSTSTLAGYAPSREWFGAGMPLTTEALDVVSVSITESGFDPQVATVTAGTTVVWTNDSSTTHRLVGGLPPAALSIEGITPSSGPNTIPALVTIQGANFAPGAVVRVGEAALAGITVKSTVIMGKVLAGLTPGTYNVTVVNPGGASATLANGYIVLAGESDDLRVDGADLWVDPLTLRAGDQAGLGVTIHRQGGSETLEDVEVSFYDGPPMEASLIAGGTVPLLGPGSSTSIFIPHAWDTTGAEGDHEIYVVVDPQNAVPEASEDNNNAYAVVTVLSATPPGDSTPPVVESVVVNENVEGTSMATVAVEVSANDGTGLGLDSMYILEYEFNQAGGCWVPVQRSGWLPFAGTAEWDLLSHNGVKYVQVWARDQAQNISLAPAADHINLLLPKADILQAERTLFRWEIAAGQAVSIILTSHSSDADLYVWRPGNDDNPPDWLSDGTTATDRVDFAAPASGVYQVEVAGYTDAQYTLEVQVGGAGGPVSLQHVRADEKPVPSAPLAPGDSTPPGVTTIPNPPIESHQYHVFLPLVLRGYLGQRSAQVTAVMADTWDSGEVPSGGQYARIFPATGTFEYHCAYHPTEIGQVMVELAPFDFALGVEPAAQSVAQGQNITYTVLVTGTSGDPEPVALTVGGLPAGATYELAMGTVTPTGSNVLSITTALTTPVGDHTLVITGTGEGQVRTATAMFSVTPHPDFEVAVTPATRSVAQGKSITYTVSLTALHGFDAPVSLAVEGLPADAAVTWAQNPLVPTGTTLLTVTTGLDTTTGSHLLTVAASGGGFSHQDSVTLEVTPHPDFALGVQPPTQTVTQGQSAAYTVDMTALHGFDEPVALVVGGLPAGAAAEWSANPVVPSGSSILTVTAASDMPVGDYTLVITGTGSGFTHTASFTLTVLPHPDFAFAVTPPTQTITQGMAVTFTAHLTAENDWDESVQLSVSGLPTGTVASWAPNPVTPDGNSLLTLTTALITPPGLYPLATVADGGLLSHTAPITLEVLAVPEPDLAVEQITTDPPAPTANAPFTLTVRVRNLGGLSITETFHVDWYADPASPPLTTTPGTGFWLQNGLAPGAMADFTATHTFTTTGSHMLWAQVDCTNVVTEVSEANNLAGPLAVSVPDFALNVQPPTQVVTQMQVVTYTACVTALYGLDAPVALAVTGLPAGATADWGVNPVTPTTSTPLVISTMPTATVGTHPLTVTATGGGMTQTQGITLTVALRPKPDLVVSAIGTVPVTPTAWTSTTLVVTVTNAGPGDALWLFAVDAYLDPSQPPTLGQTGDFSWTVNSLASGATAVLTAAHTFTTTGDVALYAQADTGDAISETDEANNVTGPITATVDFNAVEVCGSITEDTTWVAGNVYIVTCDVTVNGGVTLTLEPGAIVKFESTADSLNVNGVLLSQGTAGSPVYFTSYKDNSVGGDTNGDGSASSPLPGDWRQFYIASGGSATLSHAVVRYGGHKGTTNYPMLVSYGSLTLNNCNLGYSQWSGISSLGNLTIIDSHIHDNEGGGIYSSPQLTDTVTLHNNILTSNSSGAAMALSLNHLDNVAGNSGTNNAINGIKLVRTGGGYTNYIHVVTDTTWTANPLPYVTSGLNGVTVDAGITLTLQPGVVIKMEDYFYDFTANGTLRVEGTEESPVVFTSIKDDSVGGDTNGDGSASSPAPGDWKHIYVASGGSAVLSHAVVRYGGYYSYYGTDYPMLDNYGSLTLNNCDVRYSHYDGIVSKGGSLSIINSTIANNVYAGMWVNHDATISHSDIFGNGSYGIYNANTSVVVDALDNWWGSDSGPSPYGSGNGINYTTSCSEGVCTIIPYVDAIPWLGQQTYYGQNVPNVVYEADPVNTANGNYAYQRTDLSIPTCGLPLDFTRAYNSLAPEDGPLGYGWSHTWMVTAEESGDDVRITYGDGRQIRFTWDGSEYVPAAGVFSTLTKTLGVFQLTEKDQTIHHFDAQGRLDSVEDNSGNTTTLTYDGQSRLTTATEPAGRSLTFIYTSPVSTTLISRITDHTSRILGFTYNITSELTVVTDTLGYTTTYTYDADHRLLSITDANGHTFVTNEYNDAGRVVKQWDAEGNQWTFAYDEPDHETVVTDPLGHTTTYQYDSLLRLTSETDDVGQTASYAYDADNNRTQVTDKRSNTTYYAYDDRGNVTVITDTLAYTRTFTYDTQNNPTSETDPLGHTTVYTYDVKGNLTARADPLTNVTHWAYDAYGQVISQTDALTRTTRYAYDTYGYQTAITDALGNATTFTYDVAGRRLSETDPAGHTITYTYDAANHLLAIGEPLGKLTTYTYDPVGNRISITDPSGGVITFTYDEKDRLVSVTDPLSHTATYGYDEVNNQTVVTDALGHATTYAYDVLNRRIAITDTLGNTTHYQYDANGNRTHLTDANGNVTQYTYDVLNRLVSVTDAEGGTVTYAYDAIGNRTVMTDANSHTTTYAYDTLNRLVSVTDPLSYTTVYTYDAIGNRIGQAKADGTVITYTYDVLDHLTDVSAPGLSINYAYDTISNRTAMTDTVGVTTYAYDDLNRLTQVTAPTGTLQYAYDLNDNRTNLTYPDGKVITYTYDPANRLTTVTEWAGRVITYTYDDANRQTAIQYPNNTQATHTYDDADRLLNIVHTSTVSCTIAVFTYTLDAVGNRLTMQDLSGTTVYTYDNLYRLTQVAYPDSEQVSYAYDPMGNRTAMTSTVSGVVIYTYDAGDRLLAAGPITFTWDANGNMIGKGGATYTYDPLNRLTQVVSGTTTVQFAYNGDGVRVGKMVNGVSTEYVQDVGGALPMVLAETTGGQTSLYVYGNDLETWVDPAGNPTLYHYDGLGSVRALSNLAGQRTDAYSYDVFGAVRSHTGSAGQSFTFTGEQADGEVGLVYLRARYYDPQIGRFVSKDPFGGFDSETQSLNHFIYARNNPVLLTDPSGEIANFIVGGAVGGLVGFGGYAITTWATGGEWNWGHAAVAAGGGAIMGAALPVVAAGIASGAIAPGALGTALGVKGSVTLVGAEMGLALGVNKSILNQQIDNKPIDWSCTMKEGLVEGAFGAWSGYRAGSSAMNALNEGLLRRGTWSYPYEWSKLPRDVARRLGKTLFKSLVKMHVNPSTVWAPTWDSRNAGGGGAWGDPPSGGK